ncbi:MAG TPA: hypothetical protein VNT52_17345, partial [Acidimicrobiales bacterium]|nr:hypothetical protein [Acidimicrobiales bacterium]
MTTRAFASSFDFPAFLPEVSHVNWNSLVATSGFYGAIRSSSGAQNAEVVFRLPFPLLGGTWEFVLYHSEGTNRGIYTVSLRRSASDTWRDITTIDGYAAANAVTTRKVTGLTVLDGDKLLRLKMTDKHASSTLYLG